MHTTRISTWCPPPPTTDTDLCEVVVRDEERDMWSVWLDLGAFAPAMTAARTQQQRDAVLAKHAQHAMDAGNDVEAGRLLGRVMANEPSFEDVALLFVDRQTPDGLQVRLYWAVLYFVCTNGFSNGFSIVCSNVCTNLSDESLQAFLETRLEVLEHQQRRAQCTMLATWLLELHLDRLNRRLLDDADGAHAYVDPCNAQ